MCHAFLCDRGTLLDLGTLGGAWNGANAINNRGQIVGSGQTASGEQHAFLLQHGVMSDLGTLGGAYSAAVAINELGEAAGAATDDHAGHAVRWSADGIGKTISPG